MTTFRHNQPPASLASALVVLAVFIDLGSFWHVVAPFLFGPSFIVFIRVCVCVCVFILNTTYG